MTDEPTPISTAVKVGAASLILNLVMMTLLITVAFQNRANGVYIKECTTAGTHQPTQEDPTTGHACYDEGTRRTVEFLTGLRKSIDCVGLYITQESRAACAEIDKRLEELKAGTDPFASPPTTKRK